MRPVNIDALMSWQPDVIAASASSIVGQASELHGLESEFKNASDVGVAWRNSDAANTTAATGARLAGSMTVVIGLSQQLAPPLQNWAQAITDAQDTVNNLKDIINNQLGLPVQLGNDGRFSNLPPLQTIEDPLAQGTTPLDGNAIFQEANGGGSSYNSSQAGWDEAQVQIDAANAKIQEAFQALDAADVACSSAMNDLCSRMATEASSPLTGATSASFSNVPNNPLGTLGPVPLAPLSHTPTPQVEGKGAINWGGAIGAAAGFVPGGKIVSAVGRAVTGRAGAEVVASAAGKAAPAIEQAVGRTAVTGAAGVGRSAGAIDAAAGRRAGASAVVNGKVVQAADNSTLRLLKDDLARQQSKPLVSDPALKSIVDSNFRDAARIGNGSTADAVRHELATGEKVGGVTHSEKAQRVIKGLDNILKRPSIGDVGDSTKLKPLSQADRAVAENLRRDLANALNGY